MKNQNVFSINKTSVLTFVFATLFLLILSIKGYSQQKKSIAVVSMDTKDISFDAKNNNQHGSA